MKKLYLFSLLLIIFFVLLENSLKPQDSRKFGIGTPADPTARLDINGKYLNFDLLRITYDAPGAVASDTIILIDSLGNFGTGRIPTERFDVIGGIRIGNTNNTNAGAMRWTGTTFEGYDGTSWINLGGAVSADNVIGNEV